MKPLTEDQKGINILSLDAGSPGGVLSQMYILAELMRRLGNEVGTEKALLPSNYFDMIGGSGIGAFGALCIGPLAMSAEEGIEALQLLGVSVFYENIDEERKTIFNSSDLRETVRGIIEGTGHSPDAMIGTIAPKSHSKTVFFVSPVVDIASCHRLRSYRARKGTLQCTVLDVALACISTLGLFDYAEITPRRHKYTSVGFHHTNPIRNVLDEAEQMFGAEKRVGCVLSLGAGIPSRMTMPSNLAHLEVHGLLQAMEMQQKVVTEEASRQFGDLEAYYRFSVEGIGSGSLDDWMHWDVDMVESCTRTYLDNPTHSKELDAAVGQLREGHGTTTLNRLNHVSGIAITAKTVPPVTQFFVLRKKSWAFIERNLAKAPLDRLVIFVLSGMGGCGKSTLLSYYAQVYGSKHSHIFLIDASSVNTIKSDLQNAVRSLGPEHSQKTWEEALQYFSQDGPNKNWLIGFDNADDPLIPLQDFIPDSEHGTIFITTRNRDLCFLTSANLHWELGPMTDDEALDALLRSAQRSISPSEGELRDGARLTERLGGLALALIQAGLYCFQKSQIVDGVELPFTFRQYMEEMDKKQADLMKYSAVKSLDQYGKSVYAALNMSYSALPQLARNFLHLCGFFHHSNIPLLMLESAVENRFQQPHQILPPQKDPTVEHRLSALLQAPGKSTTIHLHKIIFSLKMFSLVVTSMSPNSVMLNYHTLISTWWRDIASEKELYSSMATRVLSTCTEPKYYLVHSSLVPHIQEVLKRPVGLHLNDMAAFAGRLMEGGHASEAEALYRDTYERCTREHGKDDRKSFGVLHNLAYSIKIQGRVQEAEKIEREVIERNKTIYAEDDARNIMTELNLANSYLQQEQWKDAETLLQRLLVIAKKKFGNENRLTLTVMQCVAMSWHGQDRHHEAIIMGEEVVETRKRVLGRDHPDTLKSIGNLASSYSASGQLGDAERLNREALEIMTRINGKDHPATLISVHNLAATCLDQGKLEEALVLAEQALEGRKRVLNKSHPEIFSAMYTLARVYFVMGRLSDGMQLQEELRVLEGAGGKFSLMLWRALAVYGLA